MSKKKLPEGWAKETPPSGGVGRPSSIDLSPAKNHPGEWIMVAVSKGGRAFKSDIKKLGGSWNVVNRTHKVLDEAGNEVKKVKTYIRFNHNHVNERITNDGDPTLPPQEKVGGQ